MRRAVAFEAIKRYVIADLPEELIRSTCDLYNSYIVEGETEEKAIKNTANRNTLKRYEVYAILWYCGYNVKTVGRNLVISSLRHKIEKDNLEMIVPVEDEKPIEEEQEQIEPKKQGGKNDNIDTETALKLAVDIASDVIEERIEKLKREIEIQEKRLEAIRDLLIK